MSASAPRVAIAGAHGQIGLRLCRLLATSGTDVVGLIRNPDHADEVHAAGASPVVCDLEHAPLEAVRAATEGADTVVFAAGAGPGSGAERKLSMDRDGAIALLRATEPSRARYLMVSAVGAEDPPGDDEVFSVYLRAKAQADTAVAESDRDWTIIRPGRLLDDSGSGRVTLTADPYRGAISRDDVAAVLAALVAGPGPRPVLSRRIVYAAGGETPIAEAIEALSPGASD